MFREITTGFSTESHTTSKRPYPTAFVEAPVIKLWVKVPQSSTAPGNKNTSRNKKRWVKKQTLEQHKKLNTQLGSIV